MNKELLTSVFERIRGQLLSRAHNVVHNRDDAQDILQDAFIRLWSSKINVEKAAHAEGLLNVTVHNLSIDCYRKSHDHPMISLDNGLDQDNGDNEVYEQENILLKINDIISHYLSARDREILLHRDRDGWEFDDIADEYELTPANVRMIVARARRTIRDIYNQTTIH